MARFHKLLEGASKDSSHGSSLLQLRSSMAQLQQPIKELSSSLDKKKSSSLEEVSAEDALKQDESAKPWNHRLVYHTRWNRAKTIFVGVVGKATSPQCGDALVHLFESAAAPAEVKVGVVEIHTPESIAHNDSIQLFSGCVSPKFSLCNVTKFCPIDHIRVRRLVTSDVEGDRSALNFTTSMYRNEKYVLLLGSMSEVAALPKDWDMSLREQLGKVQGKAVLTAQRTASGAAGLPCSVVFNETIGVVDVVADDNVLASEGSSAPMQLPVVSTDMIFGEGRLLVDAPLPKNAVAGGAGAGYDFQYSLHLFHKGYRIYGARLLGERTGNTEADLARTESSVLATAKEVASQLSENRLSEIITEASLKDFEEKSGIQFRTRVSSRQWCKK